MILVTIVDYANDLGAHFPVRRLLTPMRIVDRLIRVELTFLSLHLHRTVDWQVLLSFWPCLMRSVIARRERKFHSNHPREVAPVLVRPSQEHSGSSILSRALVPGEQMSSWSILLLLRDQPDSQFTSDTFGFITTQPASDGYGRLTR